MELDLRKWVGLIVAVKCGLSDTNSRIAVDDVDGLLADPLDRNDFRNLTSNDARYAGSIFHIFELGHGLQVTFLVDGLSQGHH